MVAGTAALVVRRGNPGSRCIAAGGGVFPDPAVEAFGATDVDVEVIVGVESELAGLALGRGVDRAGQRDAAGAVLEDSLARAVGHPDVAQRRARRVPAIEQVGGAGSKVEVARRAKRGVVDRDAGAGGGFRAAGSRGR